MSSDLQQFDRCSSHTNECAPLQLQPVRMSQVILHEKSQKSGHHVWPCNTTASPKPFFRAPWWVDNTVVGRGNAGWTTSEWTSLPIPKLLTMASCEKGWKSMYAESSLVSPHDPTDQGTQLNWTTQVCAYSLILFTLQWNSYKTNSVHLYFCSGQSNLILCPPILYFSYSRSSHKTHLIINLKKIAITWPTRLTWH